MVAFLAALLVAAATWVKVLLAAASSNVAEVVPAAVEVRPRRHHERDAHRPHIFSHSISNFSAATSLYLTPFRND